MEGPSYPVNKPPGLWFSDKTCLIVYTKGRNFPCRSVQFFSRYLPPTSVFCQSNPATLQRCPASPFSTIFLPVIFLLREIFSGYLLRDTLHYGYCSNCLLRKEVGRNETTTHSGFVMLLVSSCIFLQQKEASGQDLSTDTPGAQCCEICENVMIFICALITFKTTCADQGTLQTWVEGNRSPEQNHAYTQAESKIKSMRNLY